MDNGALSYDDVMHIYNMDQLPYLWGSDVTMEVLCGD